MARSSNQEEFEEEALSFCDLPVQEKPLVEAEQEPKAIKTELGDEFDFNHRVGNMNPMCAADEVFFQGQLLPVRLSFSSEISNNLSRNLSIRSESMDHNMSRFRNASSSSSSSRSHYSRSSSISNNSISIPIKPRPHNVFHSHPSPKPQIRSISSSGRQNRSSSRWEFLRLGLLRTPEMELHDLKNRSIKNESGNQNVEVERQKTGILGVVSCKRSVETVPLAIKGRNSSEKIQSGIREKVVGEELKKIMIRNQKEKKKKKDEGESLSHRRTSEWLKQLSHASFADEP